MKVVRESILDRVRKEIRKDKSSILRIELTLKEFCDFLYHANDEGVVFDRESYQPFSSGSYVVLQGVCIQTHDDY